MSTWKGTTASLAAALTRGDWQSVMVSSRMTKADFIFNSSLEGDTAPETDPVRQDAQAGSLKLTKPCGKCPGHRVSVCHRVSIYSRGSIWSSTRFAVISANITLLEIPSRA
ncbi:hypothetical protein D3C81_1495740 [compost metagenome]